MTAVVPARDAAWQRVQEPDSSDEARRATFGERLGFAALVTGFGAVLGYTWWHDCNDPETELFWSCLVAPRRLGTSVRAGAYTGLAVGLIGLLGDLRVVKRQNIDRATGPTLRLDHQARSGFRVGINLRF